MSREHLATYLNDHLAGSVSALEILDRLAEEASDLKPFVTGLKRDIGADRQVLVDLMARLGITQSRFRKAGGWLAERIVEDRARRGAFRTLDELARVPGIGPHTVEGLRGSACAGAPGRLNGGP